MELLPYGLYLLFFLFLILRSFPPQKRHARPISKLLNPLAKGGGYSLAVALNFTQTKMEMPKTQQSSISAFFAPKRRGKQPVAS